MAAAPSRSPPPFVRRLPARPRARPCRCPQPAPRPRHIPLRAKRSGELVVAAARPAATGATRADDRDRARVLRVRLPGHEEDRGSVVDRAQVLRVAVVQDRDELPSVCGARRRARPSARLRRGAGSSGSRLAWPCRCPPVPVRGRTGRCRRAPPPRRTHADGRRPSCSRATSAALSRAELMSPRRLVLRRAGRSACPRSRTSRRRTRDRRPASRRAPCRRCQRPSRTRARTRAQRPWSPPRPRGRTRARSRLALAEGSCANSCSAVVSGTVCSYGAWTSSGSECSAVDRRSEVPSPLPSCRPTSGSLFGPEDEQRHDEHEQQVGWLEDVADH